MVVLVVSAALYGKLVRPGSDFILEPACPHQQVVIVSMCGVRLTYQENNSLKVKKTNTLGVLCLLKLQGNWIFFVRLYLIPVKGFVHPNYIHTEKLFLSLPSLLKIQYFIFVAT